PPPAPKGALLTAQGTPPPAAPATQPALSPAMGTMPSMQSPMVGSTPPPSGAVYPSAHPPASTPSYMPGRVSMEPPRPQQSKAPLAVMLLLLVMGAAATAVYMLMPRAGTLVVNVADAKGAAVQGLEVVVDGSKRCESAPCIVRDLTAGVHEVKVAAKGYET